MDQWSRAGGGERGCRGGGEERGRGLYVGMLEQAPRHQRSDLAAMLSILRMVSYQRCDVLPRFIVCVGRDVGGGGGGGYSKRCPAFAKSVQASLDTTEVAQQQCRISSGR